MVSDLITSDVPVGDEGVVGVVQGDIIRYFGLTPIGIFAVGKELVDGVESVGLNGVVGSEDNELRDNRLSGTKSQS